MSRAARRYDRTRRAGSRGPARAGQGRRLHVEVIRLVDPGLLADDNARVQRKWADRPGPRARPDRATSRDRRSLTQSTTATPSTRPAVAPAPGRGVPGTRPSRCLPDRARHRAAANHPAPPDDPTGDGG